MIDYDINKEFNAVAQSCKKFSSNAFMNKKSHVIAEGVSCRSCNNWSGDECIECLYDEALSSLDNE